jgi:flavin-dependent dehydrogenase
LPIDRRTGTRGSAAGAESLGGEVVGRGPAGAIRLRAAVILVATGKASPLTPRSGEAPGLLAFQAHHEGPPISPRVELYTFPGGYLGLIDVEGGRGNLCMLVRRDAAQRPNRPEAFVERAAAHNRLLSDWLARARRVSPWTATPRLDFAHEEPAPQGGPLRIGDAAGSVAPMAGDGQAMALRSAFLVAPILFDFLQDRIQAGAARWRYRRIWHDEFHSRLRDARLLQRVLLSGGALRAALLVLPRVPGLGRLLIDRTRGPVVV